MCLSKMCKDKEETAPGEVVVVASAIAPIDSWGMRLGHGTLPKKVKLKIKKFLNLN